MGFIICFPDALHDIVDFMRRVGDTIIIAKDEAIIMKSWPDLHSLTMIEKPKLSKTFTDIPWQHDVVIR